MVILDRTAYIDKIMDILGDDSTFTTLGDSVACDNTGRNKQELKKVLTSIGKKAIFTIAGI